MNEISKKYHGNGNNTRKLLDLKLLSCLSKFLNRQDVELWNQKILQNHYFLIEYLRLKGADPFAKTFQEQEKAIRFIINQINKKIILILQSVDDPNGAFDKNGDQGLFSIFNSMEQFQTRNYTINSLKDVKKILGSIQDNKIAHFVLMAHGTANKVKLGKDNIDSNDESIFKFADLLLSKLDKKASIFLHSCSVGSGGKKSTNFANTLSILLPKHKIFAAENNISRGDLLVTRFQVDGNQNIICQYEIDNQKVIRNRRNPYQIFTFYNQ
jgi:hypothetical protein